MGKDGRGERKRAKVRKKYGVKPGMEDLIPSRRDARAIRRGDGHMTGFNMPKAKRVQARLTRKGKRGIIDQDPNSETFKHFSSVNPFTGKFLKQSNHKTVGKELDSPYGRENADRIKKKNKVGKQKKYYKYKNKMVGGLGLKNPPKEPVTKASVKKKMQDIMAKEFPGVQIPDSVMSKYATTFLLTGMRDDALKQIKGNERKRQDMLNSKPIPKNKL